MSNKSNDLVKSLIEVMKCSIEKENKLSTLFNTETNVYEDILNSLQSAIYKFLEIDKDEAGDFKDGLFRSVIDGDLEITDLLAYLMEKDLLWKKYKRNEISYETYTDKELTLNRRYHIS